MGSSDTEARPSCSVCSAIRSWFDEATQKEQEERSKPGGRRFFEDRSPFGGDRVGGIIYYGKSLGSYARSTRASDSTAHAPRSNSSTTARRNICTELEFSQSRVRAIPPMRLANPTTEPQPHKHRRRVPRNHAKTPSQSSHPNPRAPSPTNHSPTTTIQHATTTTISPPGQKGSSSRSQTAPAYTPTRIFYSRPIEFDSSTTIWGVQILLDKEEVGFVATYTDTDVQTESSGPMARSILDGVLSISGFDRSVAS